MNVRTEKGRVNEDLYAGKRGVRGDAGSFNWRRKMKKKLTYVNRKGTPYYFREKSGKRGLQIVCSQKESDADLTALPDTHEIVENPNGQVSCRKKIKHEITTDEMEYAASICPGMVDTRIRLFVEEKSKAIIIHSADTTAMNEIAKFALKFCGNPAGIKAITEGNLRYEPVLKLELIDKKERLFAVYRMCWVGDGDWLFLKDGGPPALLEEYVPHIGQESFYELF